jgi:hypothetical protein
MGESRQGTQPPGAEGTEVFVMKTTNERNIPEKKSGSRDEQVLMEEKSTQETSSDSGEYLCGCETGKCFDCGI